jgi:hypothetical protein
MNGSLKWCLPVAVLLLASGCSSDRSAQRGDGSLEARAQQLEERNRALREELRQKEAQIEQSFAAATQAENAAGLQGLGCAAVMPARGAPRGMPRSGEVHGRVALRNKSYQMRVNFSQPRTAGNQRVAQGNCQVVSQ